VRRHDTDVTSLVFGLIFLGLAAIWPLVHHEVIGWPGLGIFAPVLLISAGLVGLVASITGNRRRRSAAALQAASGPIDESPIDVTRDIDDAIAREMAKRNADRPDAGPK
jgi:hypothetical protein